MLFRTDVATPQDVLSKLRELQQGISAPGASDGLGRDRTSAFAVEEFARRYMRVRDDLAGKVLRGEPLSTVERATLHALDAVLDGLDTASAPLSREVEDILRDVLRR